MVPALKAYYITTPLYYVNAKPHLGHAYTNVLCDTFARFQKFLGHEVFFLTGTDEHGEKIERAARAAGTEPRAYVEAIVPHFKELWAKLGVQYDFFIRTTDAQHARIVQRVLRELVQKGDIYSAAYEGWYCTPCESFWTTLQLLEGACPDCRREVKHLAEENYFFKLSKYQGWLISHINTHPDVIVPASRRAEVLSFLERPLEDLCITRPRERLSWGIPFPISEKFVVYVWFDALLNYVTAVRFGEDEAFFRRHWPADVHVVGKDILRQHAVYWPIMLHAMGVEPPKTLIAHGWWTIEGAKVSKSRGNVVDPLALADIYGVDAFRYFLLREVQVGQDGSYSEQLVAQRFEEDLANDLGNLVSRTLAMIERYEGGRYPGYSGAGGSATLAPLLAGLRQALERAMASFDPRAALVAIWELVHGANREIDRVKPWELARKGEEAKLELSQFLGLLGEVLRLVGAALASFLPNASQLILSQLGVSGTPVVADLSERHALAKGRPLTKPAALFPKEAAGERAREARGEK